MRDPLDVLYGGLKHGVPTLLKAFQKEEGGDGQPVEVYVIALPAKFYTIKALPSVNSMGQPIEGFTLGTGSGGMQKLAFDIAEAISKGMLALEKEPT